MSVTHVVGYYYSTVYIVCFIYNFPVLTKIQLRKIVTDYLILQIVKAVTIH